MQPYTPSVSNLKYRQEFQDMKYGLFIHWGIYSMMGHGEWVMHNEKIPYNKYARLANSFYPHDFDAKKWVTLVKNAGMKYITITSRHHDGFSMFKTAASKYNIVDATPYKRDILKELSDECQRQGIKLHLYYSLLDWGRDDYGFGQKIANGKPEKADWDSYIRFMKTQLTELLTNYNIQAIWFDGHWERKAADWHYNELYPLIHRLKPDCLISNNHHMEVIPGEDMQAFEKDLPGNNSHGWGTGSVSALPLETCETINNAWGYNVNDQKYKTARRIVQYLASAAGNNANFLLNVGPMPDGNIQPEFVDTLTLVGKWLEKYGASIYFTRGGVMSPQEWGVMTSKTGKHYVHMFNMPNTPYLFIPSVKNKIKAVQHMNKNSTMKFKQVDEGVFIYLNDLKPDAYDDVFVLEF
jgi:alpha-L-fucosidase